MSATAPGEGGLRNHRVEFVRENADSDGNPVTPTDPAWELFSDRVYTVNGTPGSNLQGDRGLGDVDTDKHDKSVEEPELTVEYALQRNFLSSGNPNAAEADGMTRDSEGLIQNTHTVVDKQTLGTIAAGQTENGANQKDSRTYVAATGCKINTVEINDDPSDQPIIRVTVTYWPEKLREYQIDQPGTADSLDVVSSDGGDTSQTLIIEDDSGTTENVALNGTTAVTTTKTDWSSIDALYVTDGSGNATDTVGDITVSESGSGDALAVIDGSSSYDGIEGDSGIPATEAGSHAAAIGSAFENSLTGTLTYGGSDLAFELNNKSVTFENNLERQMRDESFRQRIAEGVRDATISPTVYGPVESKTQFERALTNESADVIWTYDNVGSITLSGVAATEDPEYNAETEQAFMTLDIGFDPSGGGTAGVTIA